MGGITKHEKYVLTKEISDDQTTGGKTSGGKQVMITVLSNVLNFMGKKCHEVKTTGRIQLYTGSNENSVNLVSVITSV